MKIQKTELRGVCVKTNIRSIIIRLFLTGTLLCAVLLAVMSCGDDKLEPEERAFLEQVRKSLENNATVAEKTELFCEAVTNDYTYVVRLLLENGVDIDRRDMLGKTPLYYAVEYNNKYLAGLLIGKGAYVNVKDKANRTPLYYVFQSHSLPMIALLINNKAKVDPDDEYFYEEFKKAVTAGNEQVVSLLIQAGVDVTREEFDGDSLILRAASPYKNKKICKMLIEAGADVNAKDEDGRTALMKIIDSDMYKDYDIEPVELLLKAGTEVNVRDNNQQTALMWAVRKSGPKTTKLILEAGADVHIQDKDGMTALDYTLSEWLELVSQAASDPMFSYGCFDPWRSEIVILLMRHGADIDSFYKKHKWYKKDYIGAFVQNALYYYAVNQGADDTVSFLIQKGFDVNVQTDFCNSAFQTPLMYAALHGNIEKVEMLVRNGADVNLRDWRGSTALIYACIKGWAKIVKIIIDAGAYPNIKDENGDTALICAARNGHTESGKLLVEAGADVNIKNKRGDTALFYTLDRGHRDFSEMLRKAGAKEVDLDLRKRFLEACEDCNTGTVKSCIEKGVNANARSKDRDWPALAIAVSHDCVETVQVLIAAGVDLDAIFDGWYTPLYKAVELRNTEIVGILIKGGAIIEGNSLDCVREAVEEGYLEILKLLIRGGAKTGNEYYEWNHGKNYLILALELGRTEIAKYLIQLGADVNFKTRGGKKAIDYAREKGYDEIVALLEKAGSR
jgi:ankyrin repeat protein